MSLKFKIGSKTIINPKLLISQFIPGIVVIKEKKSFYGTNIYLVETEKENWEGKKLSTQVREYELLSINEVRKIKIREMFNR